MHGMNDTPAVSDLEGSGDLETSPTDSDVCVPPKEESGDGLTAQVTGRKGGGRDWTSNGRFGGDGGRSRGNNFRVARLAQRPNRPPLPRSNKKRNQNYFFPRYICAATFRGCIKDSESIYLFPSACELLRCLVLTARNRRGWWFVMFFILFRTDGNYFQSPWSISHLSTNPGGETGKLSPSEACRERTCKII